MPPMAERRTLFSQIDFLLLIPILVMMTVGIMFIYSSGVTSQGASVSFEWLRQIIWVVLGLTIMVVLSFIRYNGSLRLHRRRLRDRLNLINTAILHVPENKAHPDEISRSRPR